jgi:hypothetical protein
MSYVINRTNGDILVNLPDGSLDTSTGLSLVGRNYIGFGELQQENFIKLLENFANTTRPSSALTGQLWFDTSVGSLKYYNGSVFKPISNLTVAGASGKPLNTNIGDQWFNTDENEFYMWNGTSFTLIGPTDLSRLASVYITGTKATIAGLPTTGQTSGDAYLVDGNLHIWDSERWTNVGEVQGPTGPAGVQGATGERGPQGVAGPAGAIGVQGLRGIQGVTGDTGPQGATGPHGDTGAAGSNGTSITILGSVANEAALPASGSLGDGYLISGTLYVWNGSVWENVGNIQGPQGVIGNTGPTGPQGTTGNTGPQGPQGPTGPQGSQGVQGTIGNTGPQGPQGVQGPIGNTGIQGPTGPQGLTGPEGPDGPQGVQGVAGPAGSNAWADITSKPSFASVATTGDYTDLVNKPALSTVATSGAYGDLSGKPADAIPLAGTTALSGNIIPTNTGVLNIGSSANTFANVYATTFNGTSTSAQYADVAERFHADQVYGPGTVVALGGVAEITASVEEGSEEVFGVISTRPAHLMNAGAGTDITHPAVAISGRVPVKVVGKIKKGQRLVSAGSGIAKGATRSEITNLNVIGRSLEDKTSDGLGMVEAIVRLNS